MRSNENWVENLIFGDATAWVADIYAIDAANGKKKWSRDVGASGTHSPAGVTSVCAWLNLPVYTWTHSRVVCGRAFRHV